jgi:mRNA interferase RelE/StbE
VAPAARDELGRVPRAAALRILRRLLELEKDPYGFIASEPVRLISKPDRRTLRIGDHRVVYTVEQHDVIIWSVQSTTR